LNKFKKINLTEDKLKEILKNIEERLDAEISIEIHKDGGKLIKVRIPKEEEAKLKVWFKQDGASINPKLGKNQELSLKIAEEIVKQCGSLLDINKPLHGITEKLFAELLSYLKEQGIKVKTSERENCIKTELRWHSHQRLTLHYYPQTAKLLVQGKKNHIADLILTWYADYQIDSAQDIIKLVFKSYEDIEKTEEIFPDEVLERKIKDAVGKYYDILNNQEKKWLKVSLYLLRLHKDLSEYYPTIAGTLKVIEGMLKRILLKYQCFFEKHHKFTQFEKDGTLKNSLRGNFRNPQQIEVVERMYRFILDTRHKLQHANPMYSAEVDREYAEDILNQVLSLINSVGSEKLL